MTTFIVPDYTIGNSADCQAQMIGVLQTLDQALEALEPAPNATTVLFNNTLIVADGVLPQEQVQLTKNNILIDDGSTTGYTSNPALKLVNRNATVGNTNGVPSIETYKNGRNAVAGDVIYSQHHYALDAGTQKTEFGRIRTTAISATSGAEHGSIGIWCARNGGINEVFTFNGATNDNNSLRPLDMNDNALLTTIGDLKLNATNSTGTGDIFLTPKVATGYIKPSKEILTDTKITTLQGFPSNVGSSIDFGGATVDYRFTLDPSKIELHYVNINTSTQQIYQDNSLHEAYFKQTFFDAGTSNTSETIMETDLANHRIKLSESFSGANTEITKDEIDIDDGSGFTSKLTAIDLQFNNVSIRPRRSYNSGVFFNVSGSPTGTILNFGSLADMTAGTTWKVDVAFYTTTNNTSNVLTYVVVDTTPQYVEQNSVFGYSQAGFQTAIQYDPTGTPMGTYCSFTDTFEVNGLASGACSFILTGGTSNGSFWTGTCNVSIVLTRLS